MKRNEKEIAERKAKAQAAKEAIKDQTKERKAAVEEAKLLLAVGLDEAIKERGQEPAFKAAAPEISIELSLFKPLDVEAAMPGRHWDHERIAATQQVIADILNHIVNYGVMTHACLSAGISIRTFNQMVKEYPGLSALKDEAKDLYRDKVSRTVHNRAIDGWLEPVFYQGGLIGYIRKFSDRMLELQAKRYVAEYRDRSAVDVSVAGGVLVVNSADIEDKEAWLEEQRKRRQIESSVVDGDQ